MSRATIWKELKRMHPGEYPESCANETCRERQALLAVADAAAEYQRLFHQDEWEDDAEYEDHDDNLQRARAVLDSALAALDARP